MFARITTIQGTADKVEDAIRVVENDIVPGLKAMTGFKSGYWCMDRKSGSVISMTLFESEQDLQASEAAVSKMRGASIEKLGFEVKSVDQYEVVATA